MNATATPPAVCVCHRCGFVGPADDFRTVYIPEAFASAAECDDRGACDEQIAALIAERPAPEPPLFEGMGYKPGHDSDPPF